MLWFKSNCSVSSKVSQPGNLQTAFSFKSLGFEFGDQHLSIKMRGLQIILQSCQTPHIIHHWKEDYITDDNDNDKDKDEENDNVLKRPIIYYIFEKQGALQGFQI